MTTAVKENLEVSTHRSVFRRIATAIAFVAAIVWDSLRHPTRHSRVVIQGNRVKIEPVYEG
jgi:hypothetical protein